MKSKSIRYYFFISITIVVFASVLGMGVIQSIVGVGYFRENEQAMLSDITLTIADNIKKDGHTLLSAENLHSINDMAYVTGAKVFIVDTGGMIQYSSGEGSPDMGMVLDPAILTEMRQNGVISDNSFLGGLYETSHYTLGRVLIDSNEAEVGFVLAAYKNSAVLAYLQSIVTTFLIVGLIVLIPSGIMALMLAKRTIAPLSKIADVANSFGEGDYSVRVPVEGDDELAQLSIIINEMASAVQAADKSRRSFMGNIAHELRTPMTTIKGFIDGMLDGTIPLEQRENYLEVVSDEVGRLARLTKNMLDISRLEVGEYMPEIIIFNLWESITSVFLTSEKGIEEKNLKVVGLVVDETALVRCDKDFIHQILFNLVDNAIKFANDGGVITVTVRTENDEVITTIHNTGIGMSQNTLDHIFNRFHKADKSRSFNARGAGLGLHISKILLGLMGGSIWAESEKDKYASFSFSLPTGNDQATEKNISG